MKKTNFVNVDNDRPMNTYCTMNMKMSPANAPKKI